MSQSSTSKIIWDAAFLKFSGYPAKQHMQEFLQLSDRDLLFSDIRVSKDEDLILKVTSGQKACYILKYRDFLDQALMQCEKAGIQAEVSEDYRQITYTADNYEQLLDAAAFTARTELFASCLQAAQSASGGWSLRIVIRKRGEGDPVVTDVTLPEETLSLTAQMWDGA